MLICLLFSSVIRGLSKPVRLRNCQKSLNMPLYDCMLLCKPHVKLEAVSDLVARVGKHVYSRNGVLTDIKSFGSVQLGYGIKKLDGRYFQGRLVQMTMMATPNINKELHYLNEEDRLLRWLLVKHRNVQLGFESYGDNRGFLDQPRAIYATEEDNSNDEDDDDDQDELDANQEVIEKGGPVNT